MAGFGLTRPSVNAKLYATGEKNLPESVRSQGDPTQSPSDMMTPEEVERGKYYADMYAIRKAEIGEFDMEWEANERNYACVRIPFSSDPSYPCSFIPLVTPTVEGQVAAMMESGIEYRHVTDVPSHQPLMIKLDAASEYVRRVQKAPMHFKDYGRCYDLQGNGWVNISWEKSFDKSKTKPSGFPRLSIPPLQSVLVDGRIKDYKDLQYAEYIIHEIGFVPISWARREYGDDKADALAAYGEDNYSTKSYNDQDSFTLLHVWTRHPETGNLQLIEMDTNGFVLRCSDPRKPYYPNVNNEYPFFFGRMIPRLGQFYGFGDGVLLKYMQETVNRLTDELELAARYSAQSKIAVDPRAKMDLDQLDSDPSVPVICENPQQNLYQFEGRGLNPVVQNMIEFLLREAQRATRFSDVMTGQAQAASATATAVNSQLVQGSVGIKDKKSDIAAAMEWADRYSLKLCLAFWKKPFWAKLMSEYSQFIDPMLMGEAPAAMPTSSATLKKILEGDNSSAKVPEWEYVMGDNGKPIMQDIDFDVKVILGNAIPKGRTDFYNILLGLMQIQMLDEKGMPKPFITMERARQLMEETLGIKLRDPQQEQSDQLATLAMPMGAINPAGQNVQMPTGAMANPSPDNLAQTMAQMPNRDPRRNNV